MIKRKKLIIPILAFLLIVAITVSTAWFTLSNKKLADVQKSEIDKPPTINVLNNETTTLDILNLDGLQIGKQKCIVFCVTPNSEGMVNKIVLQLAYTNNLNEKIDMYACEYVGKTKPDLGCNAEDTAELSEPRTPQTDDYVVRQAKDGSETKYYYKLTSNMISPDKVTEGNGYDGTEESVDNHNIGIYKTYKDSSDTSLFEFEDISWNDEWANNKGRYLFYALFIHWDTIENLTDKETDIVYITAKGIME